MAETVRERHNWRVWEGKSIRKQSVAQRALALLHGDSGVTTEYAVAVTETEDEYGEPLVQADDLRGHMTARGKRWFLA